MAARRADQITLVELANRLKLSPGAVSQALSEKTSTIRVSEETSKRVRKMAAKLNYRPNRMARSLRTGRSGMVGILTRHGFGQVNSQHLYYARKNAEKIGLVPFMHEAGPSEEIASGAFDLMLDSKVDALVVIQSADSPFHSLRKTGIPIFVVGNPDHPEFPSYYVDKKGGYNLLAQHLLNQGYSRITLLTDGNQSWSRGAAVKGIKLAIDTAISEGKNVSFEAKIIHSEFEDFTVKGLPHIHGLHGPGFIGMKEIIAGGKLPEAVICINDAWAQGAIRACKESGVQVPRDIAICGFDDDPVSSAGALTLTSIRQPIKDLHEAVFSDLATALSTNKRVPIRSLDFPCELMIRESTERLSSAKI